MLKMALVQSKRSVAYIYLIVASRTMVFDLSGNQVFNIQTQHLDTVTETKVKLP